MTDDESENPPSHQKGERRIESAWNHFRFGDALRLVLIAVTIPLLIWFIIRALSQGSAILSSVAAVVLLLGLFLPYGPKLLRVVLLVGMTFNILSFVVNQSYVNASQNNGLWELPAYILLACLVVASAVEVNGWMKGFGRGTKIKVLGWSLLAVPALIYIAGIPVLGWVFEYIWPDESNLKAVDPDWNLMNEASFRAAKFAVFAAFTYLGACIGSFLNVVAYCVPRGESVGLRDSKCPQCETKIQRVDNLPLFSYMNLGGRCRSCQNVIPIRYFFVELIAATIFGSLFLCELVTGCVNVPSFPKYMHTGILWIILYPKWPVIGIYFFHSLFFCCVLTLALIESERQRIKAGFAIGLCLVFLISAIALPLMQPVSINEHLTLLPFEFPSIVDRILRLVIGGIFGAAVSLVVGKFFANSPPLLLATAFALTGIVLGWQGLLQLMLIFALLSGLVQLLPQLRERLQGQPTMLLLAALLIHHPIWKLISQCW